MNYILAREIVTDKEVKNFLDEMCANLEVLKGRTENSNNPNTVSAFEDVKNMLNRNRIISDKLEKGEMLNSEEKDYLKSLLIVNKRQIEEDGKDTSGISGYINQLG